EGDRELSGQQVVVAIPGGHALEVHRGALVDELRHRVAVEAIADAGLDARDVRIPRVLDPRGVRDLPEAQGIPASGEVAAEGERVLELDVAARRLESADHRALRH